jgi:hypothetical protein
MGIRVPGTIRVSTIPAYTDSFPPWLCAFPLTNFSSRSPALTGLMRAGMDLDRYLVEFEACFRSGRGEVIANARPSTAELKCIEEFDLPPRLLALTDSISVAEFRVGNAREEALARPDLLPAERALVESVHMEILTLLRVFNSYCPTRFDPDRRHRPRFVISHAGPTASVQLVGTEFMEALWQVRWNLDSWLLPLVSP